MKKYKYRVATLLLTPWEWPMHQAIFHHPFRIKEVPFFRGPFYKKGNHERVKFSMNKKNL